MADLIKLIEKVDSWDDLKSDIKPVPITLNEKNQNVKFEEASHVIYGAYKIAIWKLGQKNKNGRIYPETLAERLCRENKVTIALDTHPEDDYEPKIKDIVAFTKNPTVEMTSVGKVLFAELYIADPIVDEKIKIGIDHGYMFEPSSSGFGELEGDTVAVSTYKLERWCDLLISDSSYEVSLSKENVIQPTHTRETVEESINNDEKKEKVITNNIEESILEEQKEILDMSENSKAVAFEDKAIKRSVRSYLKEARVIENPKERLKELEEILPYFEDFTDVKVGEGLLEELNSEIISTRTRLEEMAGKGEQLDGVLKEKEETVKSLDEAKTKLSEVEKEKEELTKNLDEANKKLDLAFSEMDKSKETYVSLKTLYEHKVAENNSLVKPEEYVKLQKQSEKANAKLNIAIQTLDQVKTQFNEKVTVIEEKTEVTKVSMTSLKEEVETEKKVDTKEKMTESQVFKADKPNYTSTASNFMKNKLNPNKEKIEAYFNDLKESYGDDVVEPLKEAFDKCRTLAQATSVFLKNKRMLNESKGIVQVDRYTELKGRVTSEEEESAMKGKTFTERAKKEMGLRI